MVRLRFRQATGLLPALDFLPSFLMVIAGAAPPFAACKPSQMVQVMSSFLHTGSFVHMG